MWISRDPYHFGLSDPDPGSKNEPKSWETHILILWKKVVKNFSRGWARIRIRIKLNTTTRIKNDKKQASNIAAMFCSSLHNKNIPNVRVLVKLLRIRFHVLQHLSVSYHHGFITINIIKQENFLYSWDSKYWARLSRFISTLRHSNYKHLLHYRTVGKWSIIWLWKINDIKIKN